MKTKTLLLLLVVLLAGSLVLTGCPKKEEQPESATTRPKEVKKPEPKPEPKPTPKPLPKPVPKLAPKLAPKPVPELAPKLVPKPAPKPGAKVPTVYDKAKVGDMVKHRMTGGMLKTDEVVKLDAQCAHVKTTMAMPNGPQIPPTTKPCPRFAVVPVTKAPPPSGVKPQMKRLPDETLTVAGKKAVCKVTETKMIVAGRTITTKAWQSDDVPLGGIVKVASDATGAMAVSMELVDFKKCK